MLSLVDSICAKALAPEPDQKLLQLFRENGDQHAFRALVEKHQGAVLAVARRFVREEDAEDVSQAVFLILVCKMRATEIVSLHSWLIGVAYRTALEARRRHARRQRGRVPLEDNIPDRNESVENVAEVRELVAILHVELAGLPKKYRDPFILVHHEEFSRAEAAKKLGCSVPTLDRRLDRARAMLARRIRRATGCDEAIAMSSVLTANALVPSSRETTSPKLVEQTLQTAMLGASGIAAKGAIKANVWALANWFVLQNTRRGLMIGVLVILGLSGAGLAAGYGVKNAQDQRAAHAVSGPSEEIQSRNEKDLDEKEEKNRRDIERLETTLRETVAPKVLAAIEKIGGKTTLLESSIDEHDVAHLIVGWDFPPFQRDAKAIFHYDIPRGDFNLRTTLCKEDWQEDYAVDVDRTIIYRGFGREIVIKLPQVAEMKAAFEVLPQAYIDQVLSGSQLTCDLNGQWYFQGDKASPCTIFQTGRKLLLINEAGQRATGKVIDGSSNNAFLHVEGWIPGLVGELSPDRKEIAWRCGNTWKR